MNSTDPPTSSRAVGQAWRQFEETILPAVADDLSPSALGLAQLSYYFGAMAMLQLIGIAMDGADSQGDVEIAMDGLWEEVEGFLEASDGELN